MVAEEQAIWLKSRIAVDGKPFFNWGQQNAINNILEKFPERARRIGMEPEAFAKLCLQHIKAIRSATSEVGREMQMMGIIWLILEAQIDDPDHPGKIKDYTMHTDFDVDFEFCEDVVNVHITAQDKFNA